MKKKEIIRRLKKIEDFHVLLNNPERALNALIDLIIDIEG